MVARVVTPELQRGGFFEVGVEVDAPRGEMAGFRDQGPREPPELRQQPGDLASGVERLARGRRRAMGLLAQPRLAKATEQRPYLRDPRGPTAISPERHPLFSAPFLLLTQLALGNPFVRDL